MKKTFQSFVFGCRVNEAERIKLDKELFEAGFSVDLASPAYLIINTCAITGKAEREARQLIYSLRKKYFKAKIVLTGCSATLWNKYKTGDSTLADIIVPNDKKSSLVSMLCTTYPPLGLTNTAEEPTIDKFRHSNRLLVKIQDGCHRFCSYCIVPYLRGTPQSERIESIISYINSFSPTPSEVIFSAINTEAFGKDTGETISNLICRALEETAVTRVAFGSIHPWSLTDEFMDYYHKTLSQEQRFVHFFHVPIQSGSQEVLGYMKREYRIDDVIQRLIQIKTVHPHALIATDVIVGFLGETDEMFEKTYSFLESGPVSRLHVFRFSSRPHTAAHYLKKQLTEPSSKTKRERSNRLLELSKKKYQTFIESLIGVSFNALVIAKHIVGFKVLLNNHVEGVLNSKHCLPGQMVHVTIIAAKDGYVVCKES
ncbi:MAG: MiaB/RimO family radical SAM methylthiotransferase [bacterium]